VGARGVRVPFGSTGKATLFPLRFACESFLLAADVDSRCVDFVVAGALEAVEDFVIVVDIRDAGSFGFIGTEGHGPEDDAWLAGAGDERHVACGCCGERPEWRGCQWGCKEGTGKERLREELLEHKYLWEMELAEVVFPFYLEKRLFVDKMCFRMGMSITQHLPRQMDNPHLACVLLSALGGFKASWQLAFSVGVSRGVSLAKMQTLSPNCKTSRPPHARTVTRSCRADLICKAALLVGR
jgi:hypothetical protein